MPDVHRCNGGGCCGGGGCGGGGCKSGGKSGGKGGGKSGGRDSCGCGGANDERQSLKKAARLFVIFIFYSFNNFKVNDFNNLFVRPCTECTKKSENNSNK